MKQISYPFSLLPTNTSLLITPRESQVLQLLASGLSNKEIAAALCLSDKTVATHMKSIFEKSWVCIIESWPSGPGRTWGCSPQPARHHQSRRERER